MTKPKRKPKRKGPTMQDKRVRKTESYLEKVLEGKVKGIGDKPHKCQIGDPSRGLDFEKMEREKKKRREEHEARKREFESQNGETKNEES